MTKRGDASKPRLIDQKREGPGSARIPPECGAIVGLKVIADRMFLLAERCLSSGIFADHLDPGRTNPDLPQVIQQKELNYGVEHLFVRKTVGAAFELADETHLPEHVREEDLLARALDAAKSLASVVEVTDDLRRHQADIREAGKSGKLTAAHIPRTPGLNARVRQSLAALRDVEINVKQIVELFYPKDSPNEPWDGKVSSAMDEKYGNIDGFEKWKKAAWDKLKEVANHRHAMIHPDANKSVTINDYELQADGSLMAPTIEIAHQDSPIERRDVAEFLDRQVFQISDAFEAMLGYLCDLNAKSFHPHFQSSVIALPNGEHRSGSHLVWNIAALAGAPFGEEPTPPPSAAPQ